MRKRWGSMVAMFGALMALGLVAVAPAHAQSGQAWMGVFTQTLDADLRDAMDYRGEGVLVNRVVDGSPAERAGIRKGDVLVSFNSRSVDSPAELTRFVRDARVGQESSVLLWRDGARRTVAVTLGNREEDRTETPRWTARDRENDDDRDGDHTRTFTFRTPDPSDDEDGEDAPDERWIAPPVPRAPRAPTAPRAPVAPKAPRMWAHDWHDGEVHELDLPDVNDFMGPDTKRAFERLVGNGRPRLGVGYEEADRGVRITNVIDGSAADRAGLRQGDLVTRVGEREVRGTDDFVNAVSGAPSGPVEITILRRGERRVVTAELPQRNRGRSDVLLRRSDDGSGPGMMKWRAERDSERPRVTVRRLRDRDRNSEDLRREIREMKLELQKLERELSEEDSDR
ncbi:MAG: PDZ domain-containing protein [Candidatus Eisenbacteria bacterium]|uniref:PDZ domain-containing protein n=1 Tax=Eiseniibacteriota bacterium TaxID=2212470 RepID=A0A849SC54_UNCEI|nr:PDZ domain-containing protein [Candidatus Eisenbacteria bacterium]